MVEQSRDIWLLNYENHERYIFYKDSTNCLRKEQIKNNLKIITKTFEEKWKWTSAEKIKNK